MTGFHDDVAARAEEEAAEAHKKRMIPSYLICLAFSYLIVKSESLRTTDKLGLIIGGYTAVSAVLMFGVQWWLYQKNVTQKVYATEAHSQRMKEYRSGMGTLIFALAAMLSSIFDYAKDNDGVSVWTHVGVVCLSCLVSGAVFYKYVSWKIDQLK